MKDRTDRHGESHLTAEEVAAYLGNDLGEMERERLERHLALCGRCCDELVAVGGLLPRARTRRRRYLVPAGLAAAALVGILAIGSQTVFRGDAPVLRSEDEAVQMLTIRIEPVSPPEGALVLAGELSFAWRAVAPDILYELVLTDAEGRVLLRGETRSTLVVPGPEVVLRSGARYNWYVDALLPSGETMTTGVQTFTMR